MICIDMAMVTDLGRLRQMHRGQYDRVELPDNMARFLGALEAKGKQVAFIGGKELHADYEAAFSEWLKRKGFPDLADGAMINAEFTAAEAAALCDAACFITSDAEAAMVAVIDGELVCVCYVGRVTRNPMLGVRSFTNLRELAQELYGIEVRDNLTKKALGAAQNPRSATTTATAASSNA